MVCSPLPACAQAVDQSQLDSDWNPHHVRWLPATVWAAQYAARGTERVFNVTSVVSQKCSACASDVATQKCAKRKLVYFCNRDCQRRAFPIHKHFCQTPDDRANENLGIVVTDNGRMECAGQNRDSRYRTAHNFLLEENSCMDQRRYSEAWEWVQKALVIGKQLKDWTIQSNALRGAVVTKPMCCDPACYIRIQPYERREQLKSVWHCNCPHCPAGHLPIIICTSGMVLMTCNA